MEDAEGIFEKAGMCFAFFSFLALAFSATQVHDWRDAYLGFSDVPETVYSIGAFGEHGLFGIVPQLGGGEYMFFGNMPPLYAALGAALDVLLRDPVASAFILNLMISSALAWMILNAHGKSSIKMRVLAVVLIIANSYAGSFFPFTNRARSMLAIMFFVALILLEKRKQAGIPAYFLLMFGSAMSQPIVAVLGAAVLSWKEVVSGNGLKKQAAMALAIFISVLVFQHKLLLGHFEGPNQVGSSIFSLGISTFIPVLFIMLLAFFTLGESKRKYDNLAAIVLLALPLLNTASFIVTQDMENTLFTRMPFGSDLVYDIFVLVAVAYLIMEYPEKLGNNRIAAGLLFLIVGMSFCGYATVLPGSDEAYRERTEFVHEVAKHGTHMICIVSSESKGSLVMIQGDFVFTPIALLNQENISFAGNLMPSQLDRGPVFQNALDVVNGLGKADLQMCRTAVDKLKGDGYDVLLYFFYMGRAHSEGEEALVTECGLSRINPGGGSEWAEAYKIE
ncbi:MAG: hypothetical protein WC488_04350 [Candidatus Micrarchaeia archaeon]